MSGVFCPNCGKKHDTTGKYCQYCGQDLEEVIMRYKNENLPVRYQASSDQSETYHSGPQQSGPYQTTYDDSYDRRSRRYYRESDGFFDCLMSLLFWWICCGSGSGRRR